MALIQSLGKKGKLSDFVGEYGQIIFNECHHISASSFKLVARQAKADIVYEVLATKRSRICFFQSGSQSRRNSWTTLLPGVGIPYTLP